MKIGPRIVIYTAAVLAIVLGAIGYSNLEEEHEHDEHSLIAGDIEKLAIVGTVLAIVAIISMKYLAKKAPVEESEDEDV